MFLIENSIIGEEIVETKSLPSVQFSNLNATTKDLINMGEWFLYEISYEPEPKASFYLTTDKMAFFLSNDGSVIKTVSVTPRDLVFDSQIVFSDLPKPAIERNYRLAWNF